MEGPHLLLRHDKAGDAIKSLPALRALSQTFPHSQFHLLVSTHNASIFEFEKGLQTHTLPEHWRLLKPQVLFDHLAHQGLPLQFSSVTSLLCDPFEETDYLMKLFRAKRKYLAATQDKALARECQLLKLPNRSPARRDETQNVALLLAQAFGLANLDLTTISRTPILSADDEREAEKLMGAKHGLWIGFCPFAGLQNRSHPLQRWENFLAQATRVPWIEKLFLLGSPSDAPRLERLRNRCYRPEKAVLCFPSTFRTLGAYLLRLDGVVAVDSGPLHLAKALGVRSLGILSGGDSERWFATRNPGDALLKRGLFSRFPSALEMTWTFRRWVPNP